MIATRRHPIDRTTPETTGWVVSCLLHGGVAIGVVFFLQSLRLAPQAEPFTWDVAMTASSPMTTPSPHETAMARRVSPSVPPTPTHPATDLPPAQPALPKPEPGETATTLAPSIEPPPPVSTASSYTVPSTQHTAAAPTHPVSPTQLDSPPITPDIPTHQQVDPSPGPQLATNSHAEQFKPIKPDYGWLSELMAKWIEDLDKRYPAMLRTEGIQGKVTLTAVLHEDGVLSDVRVAKSSGNAMLDQVAVEDVRKGPPIMLSHPLERPHMPVKFSIIYDLKTAR
ncbi:MAG: energy transducer TonB [Nitrospira sp.]|nr:energy transducer TonB [Nitrospira sp.]MBH0181104.1 energy transducer TonB [Nitrospira sp.]MBH0186273.1 energy transducer TonB [Nitrospira sp.]